VSSFGGIFFGSEVKNNVGWFFNNMTAMIFFKERA
jgi:uncharacterized membrane protein